MNKINTFICINLNDFHNNKKGAKTNAEMIFINAKDEKECKDILGCIHPNKTFSIIRGNCINKHIKYAAVE